MINPATRMQQVTNLMSSGLITPKEARILLNDIELCWLIGNQLMYLHRDHIILLMELI